MDHKKIAFLVQLLMSFVLISFCASLRYFHVSSFIEDSAVKKQQQEVICPVENECVRVLSQEKMQVWDLQAAKACFS